MDTKSRGSGIHHLFIAGVAAFCTYFCMYAFRKPFTAATFEDQEFLGVALKTVLVISQLAGYMLSKFIGIRVVSGMQPSQRAAWIVGLILFAEAALFGFAVAPLPAKVFFLFLNGLPLGMVFGLVLGYLEGRRHTEALSAALCASFIVSSGVVKSVGRWLILDWQVSEFAMPVITGLIFFPPLLLSVWILSRTPVPDSEDRLLRNERPPMSRSQRLQFFYAYWPGLSLMVFVYLMLTIVRTIRDDFGVEIWRDMGVSQKPAIFAQSETVVAIFVTVLNGVAILFRNNLTALRVTTVFLCLSFLVVGGSALLQSNAWVSPFTFMVVSGIGLYVPYVAFHTTMFERIVAASRRPANLVFLMYVADFIGYLGYALVIGIKTVMEFGQRIVAGGFEIASQVHDLATVSALAKSTLDLEVDITIPASEVMLPFYRYALWIGSAASIAALLLSIGYFRRRLTDDNQTS